MNNKFAIVVGLMIIFGAFYYITGDIDFLNKEATISIPEEESFVEEDPAKEEPGEESFVEEESFIEEDSAKEEPGEESFVEGEMNDFVLCLKEKEVVIYGSEWCPFCTQLVESFGGYSIVDPIYVECTEEREKCEDEMHTTGVPEIQIGGELYTGSRELSALGGVVGCEL